MIELCHLPAGQSGGWNSNGCFVQNTTKDNTTCSCNHLTSFAILLVRIIHHILVIHFYFWCFWKETNTVFHIFSNRTSLDKIQSVLFRTPSSPSSHTLDVEFLPSSWPSLSSPTCSLSELVCCGFVWSHNVQIWCKVAYHLHKSITVLILLNYLILQEITQRHTIQNPDPLVLCSAAAQPGVPGGRVAGALHRRSGPMHFHCLVSSLLPAGVLHLDGTGRRPHVHGSCESLQQPHTTLLAKVFSSWMGCSHGCCYYCHRNWCRELRSSVLWQIYRRH